ncbi:hypothetical protein VC218_11395 [Xanthomonas nasturtii]|uniref:hypothetical protein n=1 Tax=Xanthomonas nasturtii TaxID=1843581 RepID=UPI002B223B5F|nr:hypothetical protein [Xanthomonas nasturtii]MEA9579491.1 hypothetical protein [Xanthomonas nasturtii]
MVDIFEEPYRITMSCEALQDESFSFIKVVAMPSDDAVEFNVTEARAFAQQILSAVAIVEAGWAGIGDDRGAPGHV